MNTRVIDVMGETLPGVNIFESTATGEIISGGYYTSTDINGNASIDTIANYISFSFVGLQTQTYLSDGIPGLITLQAANNTALEGVTITASKSYLSEILLYGSLAIILLGSIYLFRKKIKLLF